LKSVGRTSVSNPTDGVVLAATVCTATGVSGLVDAMFPVLPELLGVDMLAGRFLINSIRRP